MEKYVYESHLGGFYITSEEIDLDDLYCEQCGDYDNLVSEYDDEDKNISEVFSDLMSNGHYELKYIFSIMLELDISKDEILQSITKELNEVKEV